MARIKDVADHAGVSVGTVSRVLNNHPNVGAETRRRVLESMRALSYRPNRVARSLRTSRAQIVSLIVPDITNPFFAELSRDIELACAAADHGLMVANSMESPAQERRCLEMCLDQRTAGIILVPTNDTSVSPDLGDIPLVVCDRPIDGASCVVSANQEGAMAAVKYLITLGHQDIACIAGPLSAAGARDRLAGYTDAIAAFAGKTPAGTEPFIRSGPFSYEFGMAATAELLDLPRRPTAIFASSDWQAVGALRACDRAGLRVPEDISICGFDAITLSELISPPLTTVRQRVRDIARIAVDMLRQEWADASTAKQARTVRTELMVRDSCAPPPKKAQ